MDWIKFVKKYREAHPEINGVAIAIDTLYECYKNNAKLHAYVPMYSSAECEFVQHYIDIEADKNGWYVSWHQEFAVFFNKPDMNAIYAILKEFSLDPYNKHCKKVA